MTIDAYNSTAAEFINEMHRVNQAKLPQERPNAPGVLIALEGCDATGKSTSAQSLARWLAKELEQPCHFVKFPDYHTPSGELILQYLRGELGDLDPVSTACLYALNKIGQRDIILSRLAAGCSVLCDRYVFSNISFQCARVVDLKAKTDLHLLIEKIEFEHNKLPRPDVVIQLDLPLEEAARRSALRGNADKHEVDLKFQKAVDKEYTVLSFQHPDSWINVPVYEGHWLQPEYLSPEKVHEKVVQRLQQHPAIKPMLRAATVEA